jgi:zinc transporter, ZIP family
MVADLTSIAVSLLWGFVASIPLLLGCLLALTTKLSKKTIAVIMGFGSGVLVASLAFSLIEEAFEMSQSIQSVIIGFISGGLAYTLANYYLDRRTSQGNIRHRKKSSGTDAGGGKAPGLAILVGSIMDNIPENMALGISLAIGGSVDLVLMVAIFISNFPEGLSSSEGMKSNGRGKRSILILWMVAVFIGTISSAIGFTLSSYTEPSVLAIALSFAAGAILVMLAESLIPVAYEEGGASRIEIGSPGRLKKKQIPECTTSCCWYFFSVDIATFYSNDAVCDRRHRICI